MKLNYELIVSDFDGTLIDDNQCVSDDVKGAIEDYVSAGGIFAVITGRMLCCILPQVRELGLKGLVIAYQGTVIADIETGKILKNGGMDYKSSAEICEAIENLGFNVNAYCGDELYTDIPKNNKYLKKYEQIVRVDAHSIRGKVSDYVLNNKLSCQKVACLVKEEDRDNLYFELKKVLGDRFDVTCSAKVLVEVSPLNDNKGEALRYLAGYYKIPIERTIAVGDNLNDMSMVVAAGLGCAVGNAEQELKDAAKFVSVSNNQGAVAQIIKKFGFA